MSKPEDAEFDSEAGEPDQPHSRYRAARPVARIRGWVGDRMPATLKGRWRIEQRVGTTLSAVAVASGITMGAYALWTAQPQEQSQPFTVARQVSQTTDQLMDQSADQSTDLSGDSSYGSDKYDLPAAPTPMPDPFPSSGIIVDVEGKVAKPGVQKLPTGARVLDAIMMAGGALPGTDLSELDQARVLNDGEQIMVGPGQGAGGGAGEGAAPMSGATSGPATKGRGKMALTAPVQLNSATLEQLEQLPGVGPALAQRVLDWRAQHGRFTSVDELQVVKGFGPHKFAAVRGLVTL